MNDFNFLNRTPAPFYNKLFVRPGSSLLKKEVQTTLLDSIDSILLIVFISGKQFLEGYLCVPGVAY